MIATERALIARRKSAARSTLARVTAKTEDCQACQRFQAALAQAKAKDDQAQASRILVLWRDHDAREGHVKRRG